MARSIPVEIPPFSFPTRKAAQTAVQDLLKRNHNKDLVGEDLRLAEAVLKAHPHAAQKLANGYIGMRVAQDPNYNTWCLWVRPVTGALVDVSYQVALGITSAEPTLYTAGRHLLKEAMETKRQVAFATGTVTCAVSGKLLHEGDAHVDHAPPWPFDKIVRSYVEAHGIPSLRHEGTQDLFSEPSDAERFRAYHDGLAQLRIVDRRVHLSELRRTPS
ncbi:DCL family protein [Methylobacterium sp. BTF04]|uniref:DUF3223 domain-containing protein n=1 Tax=Methylobacterium sp. BTF04 TaxID=2708300 RepID=UPI0013D77231|nr:DUF3223 domain-containing protein [Methylobacterium sp. BTF04]NEU14425.1 DCL family protein [Methylobacterium sp. BTF04]